MCTQLYTRWYTVVYTRVYFTLLGSSSTLGTSMPRVQMLLSIGVCSSTTLPSFSSDFMRQF